MNNSADAESTLPTKVDENPMAFNPPKKIEGDMMFKDGFWNSLAKFMRTSDES